MGLPDGARRALVAAVGPAHVLVDADLMAPSCIDWTGRFRGPASAVVRPGSAEEVEAVVAECRRRELGIVPQGGNTGLVGGSVPRAGEVVVSLARLDAVEPADRRTGEVVAGAGATLAAVAAAAATIDMAYGVDFGARESATVGGSIATDAGGIHVVRHGTTRRQLRGVEAVLGTGVRIDERARLEKDATGYDLSGLLCGSEGTLGIVTSARLRLVRRPRRIAVAVVAFSSWAAAVDAAVALRAALPGLRAVEAWGADEAALVARTLGLASPVGSPPVSVLVEVDDDDDPISPLGRAVEDLAAGGAVAVASERPRREALWAPRERLTEAIALVGVPHKLDVSVPLGALAEAVTEVRRRVAALAPEAGCWVFGHLGDGNLHVNVTGLAPDDPRVDDAVLGLVLELGGSVSAEHGVGVAKRAWAARQRGEAATATLRAIKDALDPDGTMNPGVLLPAPIGGGA